MKKVFAIISMIGILATMTSCGSSENDVNEKKNSPPVNTTSAVTTSATIGTTTVNAISSVQPATQANTTPAVNNTNQQYPVINPELYLFGGYVSIDSGTLNLRSAPDTNSNVLAQIPNATQLDIYSCDTNGWFQTIYNDKKGYVSSEYIFPVEGYDENAAAGLAREAYNGDDFIGTWGSYRTSVTISKAGNSYYVNVGGSNSAYEYIDWEYWCTYDANDHTLYSDNNGLCTHHVFDENGNANDTIVCTDGYASFYIEGDSLYWNNLKDGITENAFVRV